MRRLAAMTLGLLALAASPAQGQVLQDRLARAMRPAGAASGAYVVDLTSGQELFAWRADAPRAPASVEKVYTTTTALRRYGIDGQLATAAVSTGVLTPDGTLHGDLALRGGGDPTFGSRAFADRAYGAGATAATVESLAAQIVARGIVRVDGRVLGDETAWDSYRGVPDDGLGRIDPDVGPLSALAFNRGLTRSGGSWEADEARYAASRLREALRDAGVRVTGAAAAGPAAAGALELARVQSPPIADLVRLTNRPSDNFFAEMLLKGLGAGSGSAGSTAAGAAAVSQTIARDGAHPSVVDGSGLSRSDQTSPHDVVRVLTAMTTDPAADAFRRSLPVAGRSGTLHDRMRGTPAAGRCQAKTGTLSDVSALAGYCRSRSSHRIVFAILMNRVSVAAARALQDRFAAALVRFG